VTVVLNDTTIDLSGMSGTPLVRLRRDYRGIYKDLGPANACFVITSRAGRLRSVRLARWSMFPDDSSVSVRIFDSGDVLYRLILIAHDQHVVATIRSMGGLPSDATTRLSGVRSGAPDAAQCANAAERLFIE